MLLDSQCLRVSKHWKQIATSLPRLWYQIDLSTAKRPTRMATLNSYLRYAQYNVQSVHLDLLNNKSLQTILQRCKSLTEVKIEGSGLLGESLLGVMDSRYLKVLHLSRQVTITEDTMRRLLDKLPNIEEAVFCNVYLGRHPPWRNTCNKLRVFKLVLSAREVSRYSVDPVSHCHLGDISLSADDSLVRLLSR